MAIPLPQAFVIKLTHTGFYADGRPNVSSVQINDLDTGLENQNRKVTVYVPPKGTISIPASSRSLLSYSEGTIRKFVEVGVLTAEFCFQFRNSEDLGGPLGVGISLFPGIPNIERSSNLLSFLIAAGIDTSGFIVGEEINISGLSGGFTGLSGTYIIKTIEKAVDLFGPNLLTYKITVDNVGPNIAPAILVGVTITLPNGKSTFVISSTGDVGGFGTQYVQYIGGGLSVSGPIDPTYVQLTPIASVLVPISSIFISSADFLPYFKDAAGVDQPLIGGGGGGVPPTRTLTAGTGMTGGGNLSADRTFDVAANADGSIIANANDIQVGILATDAQHGVRGGGTQHAVATPVIAGFMSAADKAKLDLSPGGPGAGTTGYALFEEFLPGRAVARFGELNWDVVSSGAAATHTVTNQHLDANHQGIVRGATGSTATGRSTIFLGPPSGSGVLSNVSAVAGGTMSQEWLVRLDDLATVAQDNVILVGFSDIVGAAGFFVTNAIAFVCLINAPALGGVATSPNWQCIARGGAVATTLDSGVAVIITDWVKLRIDLANASGASFYINGVLVATIAQVNLPGATSVGAFLPTHTIQKRVGTSSARFHADYFSLQYTFGVAR